MAWHILPYFGECLLCLCNNQIGLCFLNTQKSLHNCFWRHGWVEAIHAKEVPEDTSVFLYYRTNCPSIKVNDHWRELASSKRLALMVSALICVDISVCWHCKRIC